MEITFISALNEYAILIAQKLVLKIKRILYKWTIVWKFWFIIRCLLWYAIFTDYLFLFMHLLEDFIWISYRMSGFLKNFDTIFMNYSLRISNLTSVLLSLLLSFENELSFIFWQELVDLVLHPPPNKLISSKYEF